MKRQSKIRPPLHIPPQIKTISVFEGIAYCGWIIYYWLDNFGNLWIMFCIWTLFWTNTQCYSIFVSRHRYETCMYSLKNMKTKWLVGWGFIYQKHIESPTYPHLKTGRLKKSQFSIQLFI